MGRESFGGVPEWTKGPVLKTGDGVTRPWVRIPPPPLNDSRTDRLDSISDHPFASVFSISIFNDVLLFGLRRPMANSSADSSFTTSGLENELSGYKAISGSAIFSAIMGGLSALMFVDWAFIFVPALAIFFGATALRKINRYADIYTGQKIAQAGIGLAVIFTLVAVSTGFAYQIKLNNEVTAYSRNLEQVLQTGSANELLFLKIPISQRGDLTPDKAAAERITTAPESKVQHENEMKPLNTIVAARSQPGAKVSFVDVEAAGYDKLTPYAFALYAVTAPAAAHEHKEGDDHDHHEESNSDPQYVMVEIKGEKVDGKFSWYVSKIEYPYKRGTAQLKAAPVDDGHGHAH